MKCHDSKKYMTMYTDRCFVGGGRGHREVGRERKRGRGRR